MLSIILLAAKESKAEQISDESFFKCINLDYPGLEQVKAYVSSRDWQNAKTKYVAYLKKREHPKWYINWRDYSLASNRKVKQSHNDADRYVNNELVSCGIWYQFDKKINWTYNPTSNHFNEWTWQLNRHYFWDELGKAYWESGDEKYARAFVTQLNSWIDQCLKPEDSGNSIDSPWRTIEAGIRMQSIWPNVFCYFLSSSCFDNESVIKMVKSFYEHGKYLRQYNTKDNWLAIEMNGLYTVGALFPEFIDASEWRDYAAGRLYDEEITQFYPDGAQRELSPGYHKTSLSNIVAILRLARLNNYRLPDDYTKKLENIFEYFQKIMMPDGKLPAVNDAGWEDCISQMKSATELFPHRLDFAYIASNGEKGKKPHYTSIWMPWAGWYVMRSGWEKDAFYAFFEVGPFGAEHQHEDKLSFILSAYGSRLITECGIYAYDNSLWRKYAISARGHNVARIDGKDQNRMAQTRNKTISTSIVRLKNTFISNNSYDYGEGHYSDGYGTDIDKSVTHYRSLKFVKNKYWVVTDEFIPNDNLTHSYDIWFHLNTDEYKFDSVNNIVYSCDKNSANIAIVRIGNSNDIKIAVGEQDSEIQGWVSKMETDGTYSCRPVATPIFKRRAKGKYKEYFVFIPMKQGDSTVFKKERLTSRKYRIVSEDGNTECIVRL